MRCEMCIHWLALAKIYCEVNMPRNSANFHNSGHPLAVGSYTFDVKDEESERKNRKKKKKKRNRLIGGEW